jgi:hypothetical protein
MNTTIRIDARRLATPLAGLSLALLLSAATAGLAKADAYSCRISPDGKSVAAAITNPYKSETSCQVNCQVATTRAGSSFQISCTKQVAAGAGEVVLCSKTVEKGKLVKVIGGSGDCMNPEPPPEDAKKDDDDDAKVMQQMQQMQQQGQEMLEKLKKKQQ